MAVLPAPNAVYERDENRLIKAWREYLDMIDLMQKLGVAWNEGRLPEGEPQRVGIELPVSEGGQFAITDARMVVSRRTIASLLRSSVCSTFPREGQLPGDYRQTEPAKLAWSYVRGRSKAKDAADDRPSGYPAA